MSSTAPASVFDRSFANLLKAIGPGILLAGAAIGGSHLIASTKAGAAYGFQLLILLFLINLVKYPFLLFGTRYTAVTGKSLLAGYHALWPGYLWLFAAITLLTGMGNIAGVGVVAGAILVTFLNDQFGLAWNIGFVSIGVILVCALIVVLGRYPLLDRIAKVIISLLALTTLVAFAAAVFQGGQASADLAAPSPWNWASIGFLIVFMGWMPIPIEGSAWSSLWMFSREKETQHRATQREAEFDFNLGYASMVILAIAFMGLGALVWYGTGVAIPNAGVPFVKQLVAMFTNTIGAWAYWVIMIAAFTTMLSTTITVVDAYPRGMAASIQLLFKTPENSFSRWHIGWVVLQCLGAFVVIQFFLGDLLKLIDFAMVISFLAAPALAWINWRLMNCSHVPEEKRPRGFVRWHCYGGLAFLLGFSALFVVWFVSEKL